MVHETLENKGMDYTVDIEKYFYLIDLKDDDFTRRCLKYIEKADYVNKVAF